MKIFNFSDLSKQAKIEYNALYNVIFDNSYTLKTDTALSRFNVPLCLNANNEVCLTDKNFIFFESILNELKLFGFYNIIDYCGRAVDDAKTNYSTVEIVIAKDVLAFPCGLPSVKNFDYSDVDTNKLLKRNGKQEKAKTKENKTKKEQEKKEQEETSKKLEEKNAEIESLKKEVAKKDEQLNKQAMAEFNDDALFTIADCIEVLIKKHCPIPPEFDFSTFENDLFQVINSHWDLKVLDVLDK